MKKDGLKIIRFFFSFGCFTFISIPIILFLRVILKMELSGDSSSDLLLVDTIHSSILFILMIILYKDKLKESIKKVKALGGETFIKKVIVSGLILFIVKIVASLVVVLISTLLSLDSTTVDNQALIEEMVKSAPFIMMISCVLFAPVTEELIFRSGIYDVIKNKRVYIAVSGLIFGLMHVTDSVVFLMEILLLGLVISRLTSEKTRSRGKTIALSVISSVLILLIFSFIYYFEFGNLIVKIRSLDLVEVVGSIAYIAIGCYLAKLYTKNENIIYTISVHAFNNLVSMLLIM